MRRRYRGASRAWGATKQAGYKPTRRRLLGKGRRLCLTGSAAHPTHAAQGAALVEHLPHASPRTHAAQGAALVEHLPHASPRTHAAQGAALVEHLPHASPRTHAAQGAALAEHLSHASPRTHAAQGAALVAAKLRRKRGAAPNGGKGRRHGSAKIGGNRGRCQSNELTVQCTPHSPPRNGQLSGKILGVCPVV
jgi:hypothetical protein